MLYIDAFNHILPKKYQAVLEQKVPNRDMSSNLSRYAETVPTLLDLDARQVGRGILEGHLVGLVALEHDAGLVRAEVPVQVVQVAPEVDGPLVQVVQGSVAGAACECHVARPDDVVLVFHGQVGG